jgi:hypothetical protein
MVLIIRLKNPTNILSFNSCPEKHHVRHSVYSTLDAKIMIIFNIYRVTINIH